MAHGSWLLLFMAVAVNRIEEMECIISLKKGGENFTRNGKRYVHVNYN